MKFILIKRIFTQFLLSARSIPFTIINNYIVKSLGLSITYDKKSDLSSLLNPLLVKTIDSRQK